MAHIGTFYTHSLHRIISISRSITLLAFFILATQSSFAQYQGNDSLETFEILQQAREAFSKNKNDKAIELFTQVLTNAKKGCDILWVANAYHRLGDLYLRKKDVAKALEIYLEGLEIALRDLPSNHWRTGKLYYGMAKCYYRIGQNQQALVSLRKAYRILTKNPHFPIAEMIKAGQKGIKAKDTSTADYYRLFGSTFYTSYQLDSAIYYFQKALKQSEEMNKYKTNSIFLNSNYLARVYTNLGDYEKAHKTIRHASEALRTGDNLSQEQIKHYHKRLFSSQGNLYTEEAHYKDAIYSFQQSSKFLSSHNDSLVNLYQLIEAYLNNEDIERAKFHLVKLKNRATPESGNIAKTLIPFFEGKINYKEDNFAQSISNYHQSLALAKKHRVIYAFRILINLGLANQQKGNYSQAIRNFYEALNSIPRHRKDKKSLRVFLLQQIGFTELKNSKPHKAIEYFDQALGILAPQLKDEQINNVEVVKADQFLDYTLECISLKAKSYYSIYQQEQDTSYLRRSVDQYLFASRLVDNNRSIFKVEEAKLNWASQAATNSKAAIKAVLEYGKVTGNPYYQKMAFSLADKSKASLLAESFNSRKAQSFSNISQSILNEEKEIKRKIAFYEREIFEKGFEISDSSDPRDSIASMVSHRLIDLKEEHLALQDQIKEDYPKYFNLKYDVRSISVEESQALLKAPNETIIEFSLEDSFIYAFLITKENFEVITLPLPDSLNIWVETMLEGVHRSYQSSISNPELYQKGVKNFTDYSALIYQHLLEPIYKNAPLPEKLTIIPDGVLGYVPFDILLTEKPKQMGSFQNYQYLIKKTEISYAYSVKLYQEMVESKNQVNNNKILAFAPSFPNSSEELIGQNNQRTGYYNLLHNKAEVSHLEKVFPCKAYKDKSATKKVFMNNASKYHIIHLATHAKVDDRNPDLSHIAFNLKGNKDKDDQILTTSEIYTLNLNAALAVLSACETGLGRLRKGEGIISMGRAFSYAGAKSVVYSLWSVDDESTTKIMTGFYDHMGEGESKSAALRNAKLDYLDNHDMQHAHPFFWAAMVPVGDMSPLDISPKNNQTFWLSLLLLGVLGLLLVSYQLRKGRKS